MWKVYKLSNSALDECFVGVTDGDPQHALRDACDGEVEVIDHWDGEEHRITLDSVAEYPSQQEAVEAAKLMTASGKCLSAEPG